jgi:electron transfer flavoprotein alpha subunit
MQKAEVWLYCEYSGNIIENVVFEMLNKGKELVQQINTTLSVIVIGYKVSTFSKDLIAYGANKVYVVDDICYEAKDEETHGEVISELVNRYEPQILLIGGTVYGRALAPWVASKLKTGVTADCTDLRIAQESGRLIQIRPAFGGNIMAQILCEKNNPQIATVRPKIFEKAKEDANHKGEIIEVIVRDRKPRIKIIDNILNDRDVINLADADIVVAGGRGIKKEGFEKLRELAALIGASVGATRAVVDAGWIDYKYQVGQTGIIIRPEIYFAFGISGAVEHITGMSNSVKIIAINNDPEAAIFDYAHYKIIGDAKVYIESMIHEIEKRRKLEERLC